MQLTNEEKSFRRAFFEAAQRKDSNLTLCFDWETRGGARNAVFCVEEDGASRHIYAHLYADEDDYLGYTDDDELRLAHVICPRFAASFKRHLSSFKSLSL
jgi:hypothetical protein